MGILHPNSNAAAALTSAIGIQHDDSTGEKIASVLMHLFLYGIIFLGGYIFAKIQTLLSGL